MASSAAAFTLEHFALQRKALGVGASPLQPRGEPRGATEEWERRQRFHGADPFRQENEPRLGEDEAEAFAEELDRARAKLGGPPAGDPWDVMTTY